MQVTTLDARPVALTLGRNSFTLPQIVGYWLAMTVSRMCHGFGRAFRGAGVPSLKEIKTRRFC